MLLFVLPLFPPPLMLLRSAVSQPEEKRTAIAQEIWKLLVDQVWSIGIVGLSPAYMGTRVVNERLENVPARTCVSQHCRTTSRAGRQCIRQRSFRAGHRATRS